MRNAALSLFAAVALVVANMIGSAVFTSAGLSLGDLHSRELVLLAWVVGGVLAVLGALSYTALARRLPGSGGEYHYLETAVHPLAGFLAGWVSLIAGFTAPIALAGHAMQRHLEPWTGPEVSPEAVGTAAIAPAGLMHGFAVRGGALAQAAIVVLKLALLAVFVGSTLEVGAFFAWREVEKFDWAVASVLAGVPLYYLLRRPTISKVRS